MDFIQKGKVPEFFMLKHTIISVQQILLYVFSFIGKSLQMESNELIIAIIIAVVLGGILAYLLWLQRKQAKQGLPTSRPEGAVAALPLKLQAYERLILLADRISLPNLISRSNQPGLGLREMQHMLVQTIRQEFDHNITQQIYVSPEAWDAIRNLKEQNLLIINQVASFLPETASGQDLNKALLEMVMQNPKASLHHIVSDALSFEAKKVLS
jgi:hypothetical protein